MTVASTLALLLLFPLMVAALAFAVPRLGRWLALGTGIVVGLALVRLTDEILAEGVRRVHVGGWGAPLGIDLRVDGLAVLMLIVTAGVKIAVSVYAQGYFAPSGVHRSRRLGESVAVVPEQAQAARHRERYFWPLLLFLWAALNALFLSADIFNLYVTLELASFAAVSLVALAGQPAAWVAAMRYLLVTLAASLFYLMGVALLYGQYSTVDLTLIASRAEAGPTLWVAVALMTGGLIAKAALFPMHFWLPPAHANAPAPVSALLSALVVKGAFYILLRLFFEPFDAVMSPEFAQFLGALGGAAVLWGSAKALVQKRLKLLIAYSTVAQLGYLFLAFPLAFPGTEGRVVFDGAIIFLGAHACAKTAMFLAAGNILHAAGHDRIKDLDGITHVLPVSVFAFALSGMSLVGLPPSGGFAGKWLLLTRGLALGQWWWVALMVLGSLLAAAYVMRMLTHAFTRVSSPASPHSVPRVMEWTALVLALLAMLLGFGSSWPEQLLEIGAPGAAATTLGGHAL
jgi:formate hydrogenlyase subunit 3/multisubunit Na+/H+ antiporter MnhD subunit